MPSTRGGTSSSSAAPAPAPAVLLSIKSFKNPYCCGPTCFRMSGSISLIYFDSGCPTTDRRFSRTENWTRHRACQNTDKRGRVKRLTLWSTEMHHSVVVFEHVHFFNVIKRLHAYPTKKSQSVTHSRRGLLTELFDSCFELLIFLHCSLCAVGSFLLNSPLCACIH